MTPVVTHACPSEVPDSLPLFVFGSLMDADVMAVVLGRDPSSLVWQAAALTGYRRQRAAGEVFPILVAADDAPQAQVVGALLLGASAADLDRILFYEGPTYHLETVAVDLVLPESRAGKTVGGPEGQDGCDERRRRWARVFMATSGSGKGDLLDSLKDSGEAWELASWQAQQKPLALLIADELMALFGQMPSQAVQGPVWEAVKARALSRLAAQGSNEATIAA